MGSHVRTAAGLVNPPGRLADVDSVGESPVVRQQLAFSFRSEGVDVAASSPSTTSTSPSPSPSPSPSSTSTSTSALSANAGVVPISRTRRLVDAITSLIPGARVVLTDTRSVLLSQSERDGVRTIRVHQMFLEADDEVRRAVALYLATGNHRAGEVVDAFTKGRVHLLEWTARPFKDGAWRGAHHDLLVHYDAINARYFADRIVAEIGWSQAGAPTARRRSSITFGSYDHRARRIVIHPVLDAVHVPPIVVARIVHHEMLHAKHGEIITENGRRVVHSKAFRAEEATFHGAAEADRWIDTHLEALLRWRPTAR
jgi:hypothetical protein